jgi:PAS domain-containing protein
MARSRRVKHMDETGLRIGGKTRWLHVAATALFTFYRVCQKRGSLLANVVGTVVHDHWKPYYTMTGVRHALCNAHHLRELNALVEIEKEDWARGMQQLLRRACHAANLVRQRDRAAAAREAHLQSILDTVPGAMIVIDEQGVIQSFSAAAERLFGYSAAEAIGKNVKMNDAGALSRQSRSFGRCRCQDDFHARGAVTIASENER